MADPGAHSKGSLDKSILWPLIGLGLTIVIAVAVLTTQWQTTLSATQINSERISKLLEEAEATTERLTVEHETDIARLDESNRNRRDQIADLEERIAILEERTRAP